MRRLFILLSFVFVSFALFSCSDDGIVVTLKVLNENGKYENIKIKDFEKGQKLVDRITKPQESDSADIKALYNSDDDQKYTDARKRVTLKKEYKSSDTVFAQGAVLTFKAWQDKKMGEAGATEWDIAQPLTKSITVYAVYSQNVFATVDKTSFVETVSSTSVDRNLTFNATVTFTGAVFNTNITENDSDDGKYVVVLDLNSNIVDDGVARVKNVSAEEGKNTFSFEIEFIGEDAKITEDIKEGVILAGVHSSKLEVSEGFNIPDEQFIIEVEYRITYEAVVH